MDVSDRNYQDRACSGPGTRTGTPTPSSHLAGVLPPRRLIGDTSFCLAWLAPDLTLQNVLYGIFPVIAGSWAVCAAHNWWVMRASNKFKNLQPGVKISRVHKFEDPQEVEVLSRVMRKFDIDGVVDDEAGALGEAVIKAGLQAMPSSPFLYIL